MPRSRLYRTVGWILAAALAAHGCAGVTVETRGPGAPPPDAAEARGVPGFDTRVYPGDRVMAEWREASPYRWVGFYLPAPCYTGTSWEGKRRTLRAMGWGIALLFVGEQDWPESADVRRAALASGVTGDRCTRTNLSGERGRRDGGRAAEAARAEGFPAGTVVYLDVEPVDSVSTVLAEYVAGWTAALLETGYTPGLYAHARNADALRGVMARVGGGSDGETFEPRLWVARPGGFSLRRGPTESGYPATIWQGALDVDERWAGTTLRIDQNVAATEDPSG